MATTPLSAIPTLARLYQLHQLQPSGAPDPRATSRFNHKISLVRHDITRLEVDAIVNAANESLLGGGGVDGAIHRAAGPGLVEECESLGGCRTGSAKITGAYGKLPCKKVIHAVGPVYRTAQRQGQHGRLLQGCYAASLDLAAQNDCRSIAFSALSTGVYGYPSHEAAETAIQAVKAWLEADDARAEKMERVVFCQFMQKDVDAYHEFAPKYFAPAEAVDKMDANTADEETAEAEDAAVPDLPDVPTGEPKKSDEPESKRQKLDETAEVSIPKQNRAVSA